MSQKEHVEPDTESGSSLDQSSIFNNTAFKQAFNSLSDKDKEKYKKIGEELYNTTDFPTAGITSKEHDPNELVAHIENQLRSGIHPSDMEEGEKLVMYDAYGEEWYVKWGYVKEDLDNIITTKT